MLFWLIVAVLIVMAMSGPCCNYGDDGYYKKKSPDDYSPEDKEKLYGC